MWLTGAMRRVAQDVGTFAPLHARIGLRHRARPEAAEAPEPVPADSAASHDHGSTPCSIDGFDSASDTLLCIWDDSAGAHPVPRVRLEADPAQDGRLRIRLGRRIVATVHGPTALTSADIAVMPLSSARALGLAPPDGTALQ